MRIGKTRLKLASMLQNLGFPIEPEDLQVNYYYNSKYFDGCSWDAWCQLNGYPCHLFSWDTMSQLIGGFEIEKIDHNNYELHRVYRK